MLHVVDNCSVTSAIVENSPDGALVDKEVSKCEQCWSFRRYNLKDGILMNGVESIATVDFSIDKGVICLKKIANGIDDNR